MNVWQLYLPILKAAMMLVALTLVIGIIVMTVPMPYANYLASVVCVPSVIYIIFYMTRATVRIVRSGE